MSGRCKTYLKKQTQTKNGERYFATARRRIHLQREMPRNHPERGRETAGASRRVTAENLLSENNET
jgi:hypothetical protein